MRPNLHLAARFAVLPLLLSLTLSQLTACVPVVVVGALAGAASVGVDRRSVGTQAVDRGVQLEMDSKFARVGDDFSHLNVTVYNRKLLLTGEVRDAAQQARFVEAAKANTSVREVADYTVVGRPSTFAERSQDASITGLLKTTLLATEGVPTSTMRMFTEAGTVYLMGLVTEKEGQTAAYAASGVQGVKKVVKVFDYISEAERDRIDALHRSTPSKPAE